MIAVRKLSKSFGSLHALRDVNLDFLPGEIHAVVGENGAGKSTLLNLICGEIQPTSGEILVAAERVCVNSPIVARKLGIGVVHQHFMLVPNYSVAENFALADIESEVGFLDSMASSVSANETAEKFGWKLDLEARTGALSVGEQQRIEILKVLAKKPTVLLLDEPTAVLTPNEVSELFELLRQLKSQGLTIVLIAHKLSEVFAIADKISVLRLGQFVATFVKKETTQEQVAEAMTGELHLSAKLSSVEPGEVLLSVKGISVKGARNEVAVETVSFDARAGEILGIGGVDGNGQIELADALSGVISVSLGSISVAGKIGMIPADRRADGLATNMSVLDNLLVGSLSDSRVVNKGILHFREMKSIADEAIQKYQIKVQSSSDLVSSLSGGNQQKIVIARVLAEQPDILIAVNPTRGLDFAASNFVREQLRLFAASGKAVVLFSVDTDELAEVAHRTFFMSRGRLFEAADAVAYAGGSH